MEISNGGAHSDRKAKTESRADHDRPSFNLEKESDSKYITHQVCTHKLRTERKQTEVFVLFKIKCYLMFFCEN